MLNEFSYWSRKKVYKSVGVRTEYISEWNTEFLINKWGVHGYRCKNEYD